MCDNNSPLEQFNILVISKINLLTPFSIVITNSSLILILILWLVTFIFYISFLIWNPYILTKLTFCLEVIYNFILSILKQQISSIISIRYFPFLTTIFIFILLANVVGLLPYGFTITGHIILTLQLALSIFIGIIAINLFSNQLGFFNLFIPSGVSAILLPFLVVIEVVSFLIRPFSLAVRLFANMLAGHTLLNIMSAFVFNLFKGYPLLVILPLMFVVFIVVLEFCIALVQAYIFTILTCIYLNDIYSTGH